MGLAKIALVLAEMNRSGGLLMFEGFNGEMSDINREIEQNLR